MKVRIEGTTIDTYAIGRKPPENDEWYTTSQFNLQLKHDYKIQVSRSSEQERKKLTPAMDDSRETLTKLTRENVLRKRQILESYWQNNEDLIPICEE